jgi:Zn-dependent peptidase ImmA (M78 family)
LGKDIVFQPMSGAQIDRIALGIIRDFQPDVLSGDVPFDIERFVDNMLEDQTGVEPDYRSDLPEGIYGITDSEKNAMLINAALADDLSQERFLRSTLGHETGHCFIHVPRLRLYQQNRIFTQTKADDGGVKLYRKDDIPLYMNPEWQAYRFSGALLVPERPLRIMLEKGEPLSNIAERFNVHMAFLRSRLKALKIIK